MKIAFLGTGKVGAPLAHHLAEAGHEVVLARLSDGSKSLEAALARSPRLRALPVQEALVSAEVVFVATPFGVTEALLGSVAEALEGKVLVDCTNPIGPGLSHGLHNERSGSALLQATVPKAHVVKAFTIYGFENLEDPSSPTAAVRPAMLFCGDDAAAKGAVATLIEACGFEPVDVGGLVQALHLEHLTLLWVRMVRAGGHSPHLMWAALRR
jgi:predicted dinucleotide-binding enzyme